MEIFLINGLINIIAQDLSLEVAADLSRRAFNYCDTGWSSHEAGNIIATRPSKPGFIFEETIAFENIIFLDPIPDKIVVLSRVRLGI